jgi:hypothetical protein
MTSQGKLIAGTVAVALAAGGGAALAAIELTSSPPAATTAATAPLGTGIASFGLGPGRLGGRGLGGGLGAGEDAARAGDGRFLDGAVIAAGLAAAASFLHVPAERLRLELASGRTLAQVAAKQGKPVDGLVTAMLAAGRRTVARAVASGLLTQAAANRLEPELGARTQAFVAGGPPDGGRNGAPHGDSPGGGTGAFGSNA